MTCDKQDAIKESFATRGRRLLLSMSGVREDTEASYTI